MEVGRTVTVPLKVVKGRTVTMAPLLMNIWHPKRQMMTVLIFVMLLLKVVVGRTVTVLEGVTGGVVDVRGKVVVGRTVTVLEGVEALVVIAVVGVIVCEELVLVVNVSVLVRVLALVLVLVLGRVVKKSVEKDVLLLVLRVNVSVKVKPLSIHGGARSDEDSDSKEGHEGDPGEHELSRERELSRGHDEGSRGSHLEVSPLNQLRSLTAGPGSSS